MKQGIFSFARLSTTTLSRSTAPFQPIRLLSKRMNETQYAKLVTRVTQQVAQHLKQNVPEGADTKTSRQFLKEMLTVAPVDFPLTVNAEIGKILEYETLGMHVTKWMEIRKVSRQWNVGLWKGDITTLEIDAIVNAANKYLLGCFTPNHNCIDNVIHARAGPLLREECRRLVEKLPNKKDATGKAQLTLAYNLPSKYVIHTVGPIIRQGEGEKPEDLASSYRECLNLAKDAGLRSIAFCCISTGVFGYPQEAAAHVALKTVKEWLSEGDNQERMDLVVFNVFTDKDHSLYDRFIPRYFPDEPVE